MSPNRRWMWRLAPTRTRHARRYRTTDEGVQLLVTRLQRLQPTLMVLEATGGLERMVVAHLLQAGVPTARVQPRRVRALAHAAGRQATTDRRDARVLARCAERVRPPHH